MQESLGSCSSSKGLQANQGKNKLYSVPILCSKEERKTQKNYGLLKLREKNLARNMGYTELKSMNFFKRYFLYDLGLIGY